MKPRKAHRAKSLADEVMLIPPPVIKKGKCKEKVKKGQLVVHNKDRTVSPLKLPTTFTSITTETTGSPSKPRALKNWTVVEPKKKPWANFKFGKGQIEMIENIRLLLISTAWTLNPRRWCWASMVGWALCGWGSREVWHWERAKKCGWCYACMTGEEREEDVLHFRYPGRGWGLPFGLIVCGEHSPVVKQKVEKEKNSTNRP